MLVFANDLSDALDASSEGLMAQLRVRRSRTECSTSTGK
jgi:hypothetical protein